MTVYCASLSFLGFYYAIKSDFIRPTDDENSLVEGVITSEGLLDGSIQTPTDEYYIEPADRYFDSQDFHSIIYLLSAVVFPTVTKNICHYFHSHSAGNDSNPLNSSKCCSNCSGSLSETSDQTSDSPEKSRRNDNYFPATNRYLNNSSDEGRSRPLDAINAGFANDSQNSDHSIDYSSTQSVTDRHNTTTDPNNAGPNSTGLRRVKRQNGGTNDNQFSKNTNNIFKRNNRTFYWKDFDSLHYTESEPYGVRAVQRTHWTEDRQDRHVVIDPKKTTCMLYLQADHLFYEKMGSDEACIEAMTRHVQKVNAIYRNTGQYSNTCLSLLIFHFSSLK